ncbi:hypothetical protein HID58_040610 [Brassica napus]|uniref:Coatomer subunit beta n=1 Tax=Brassica napus TaxID=3708 RepID=A0ABQ8B8I3_BRANA|nr:hypothetical protein HID58_040610 [Brassica napus]
MEKSSTLLVYYGKGTPAVAKEIKEALKGNDVEAKVDAMKKAVMLLLNGETIPQLFITIIRYVLPSEDHTIQKLLLLYLELIEKTDSRGKVLPEMILICQILRNNLQHPNEYIRGVTLRFLCRLKETEIVKPLTPSVLQNLEHRHPFVRRNAILAIMSIYKLPNGDQLFVDAPEMIEKALSTEQDPSAKRNAFLMLFTCAEERAVNYLLSSVDKVSDWNESLQMVVLELIRSVSPLLLQLSMNVLGLLFLSRLPPTAIRAAANTYCLLLLSQSDNNVKLILLDRLSELKSLHRDIMVELIIDVLRALSVCSLSETRLDCCFLNLGKVKKMEKSSTLLVYYDKGTPAVAKEIKEALEGNDVEAKVDAMKKAVMLLLNGETIPQLFITIIRYVLPSEDHTIQKLLLLYLELIEKTDSRGKVLPEMILICQNLRNNLQHPNEYIRGVTLRFLCRLKETEIVEPLTPSVLQNLEHRHPFVRRIAILAIMSIYKLPNGDQLFVDAPEMIEKALSTEQDPSAKRNAFLMLFTCAEERAVNYLLSNVDKVSDWNESLQMVVLELIRSVCKTKPTEKGKYIKIIISLLSATSSAVIYECAGTLVSLSSAPTAIRAAANTYCLLLLSQSDNNVKLILLDRLSELKSLHRDIMVELIIDVLRALSSPNLDIRKKTLDIALDLITHHNINEVVQMLKKEVVKTQSGELEKNGEYRQMLIQAIHACAVKFPEVASTVVHLLMDFLGDSNVASALDVISFVREIIETNPKLRVSIITRLLDTFYQIRAGKVCPCALWIIGEYCLSFSEVESGISTITQCLGELPFYSVSEESEPTEASKKIQPTSSAMVSSRKPVILADGTYATQSAASETTFSSPTVVQGSLASGNLRALLLTGDFFLGAVVACTLTKLVLRLEEVQSSKTEVNKTVTQALLIMVSMLQLGQSPASPHPIDNDSYERIVLCIKLLCHKNDGMKKIWLESCRQSFVKMISEKQLREMAELKAMAQTTNAQPDDLIDFFHLKSRKGMSQLELEDQVQDDLKRATGEFTKDENDANKLNRILQLTGFSDPVYAEAYVTVHHYDIALQVTVINRTKETLQNLCLELATMGDLKLVERPQNYSLAPGTNMQIKANIKVSSTETGVIFGNIVYETSNVMERNVVVLNDIHIDIMDYISPAVCTEVAFRTMWAEFEWENKVAVNTTIQNERKFLDHIIKSTNMKCLTPPSAIEGECGFLSANLYAKSVFGEDALVNVSIEKQTDGALSGYIRIRSKTQGIALSLGDKITLKQKGLRHRCFHHLSIKYGPVVLLHLGFVPTVVISSSEAAEEVLRTNDLGCCSRPKTVATGKLSYGFKDISFAQYGEYWREMRKLAVVELFSLKKVHSFKNIREEEVGFMVKKVSESSLKQSPVDLNKTFFSLTASIICRVALGQNFNESGFVIEQDRIEELVRDALVALGSFTCSDVFPGGLGRLLDWLFGGHKRINKVFEELDAFYQHVIDDHLKPEAAGKKAIDSAADIVALLLDMMEKQGKKDYFKLINISNIKGNIFLAGIDTGAITMIWAMTELVRNPKVMRKAQEEIRTTLGLNKERITEEDVDKVGYPKAHNQGNV